MAEQLHNNQVQFIPMNRALALDKGWKDRTRDVAGASASRPGAGAGLVPRAHALIQSRLSTLEKNIARIDARHGETLGKLDSIIELLRRNPPVDGAPQAESSTPS